mgnify:CR=1 FL=1
MVSLILAIFWPLLLQIFLKLHLSSVLDISVKCMICHSELCHNSLIFCFLHSLFSLYFSFGSFCDLIFKLTNSLLGCVQPTDELSVAFSISVTVFLII